VVEQRDRLRIGARARPDGHQLGLFTARNAWALALFVLIASHGDQRRRQPTRGRDQHESRDPPVRKHEAMLTERIFRAVDLPSRVT
jgi:hypothetical protein